MFGVIVNVDFNCQRLQVRHRPLNINLEIKSEIVDRDSSDSTVTRYRLDGPGIKSFCREDSPQPSRPAVGPTCVLYSGHRPSFPVVKRPERGVDHPPQLAPWLNKE